jgi:hypothetical protein
MAILGPFDSPSRIGRFAFAAATLLSVLLGLTVDPRWFAASASFGTLWWLWDFIWNYFLGPLGGWFYGLLTGSFGEADAPGLTTDDTIRMLEDHLRNDGAPRHVQIESAIRLEELYRLARKDPAQAAEVMRVARERWPDAPELARHERHEAGS